MQEKNSNLDTLGKRIAYVRKKILKIRSQVEFGALFGVQAPAVSKWEKDKRGVDISILEKLAEISDVSIEWLVRGYDIIPEDQTDPRKPLLQQLRMKEQECKRLQGQIDQLEGERYTRTIQYEKSISNLSNELAALREEYEELKDKFKKLESRG